MERYLSPAATELSDIFDRSPEMYARSAIAAELSRLGRAEQYDLQLNTLGSSILKIYGPCNLECDYCIEYEHADKSWRDLPAEMSPKTIYAAGKSTAIYAKAHGLREWSATFHGGEALMVGAEAIDKAATLQRKAFAEYAPGVTLRLGVVTNGVLLSEAILEKCKEHDVKVVVSLDGGEQAHNRHRVNKAGIGTYKMVKPGINRLREKYGHLYGGLLAVIDTDNDPITDVYEPLCSFDPPSIDLFLPYATWDNPPPAYVKRLPSQPGTPYADWLIPMFDRWQMDALYHKYDPENHPKPPGIRTFQSIIDMDLGGISSTEALGPYAGNEFIVRPGGSIELADGLKSTFDGAVKTNFNIHTDSVEDIATHLRAMNLLGRKTLAFECEICPIHQICGAGHMATRYMQGDFYNPSVYCDDLMKIIKYVQSSVSVELQEAQLIINNRKAIAGWSERVVRHIKVREALERKKVATIRQATKEDAGAMVSILKTSLRADYANDELGLNEEYWDNLCTPEWEKNKKEYLSSGYIDVPGSTAHVAVVDGAIVGFALTKEDECAGLYVLKSMRRRHIATALLERSLKSMLELGHNNTWAGVASKASKTAAAFYEANKFMYTGDTIGEGHNGRTAAFDDYKMSLTNLEETHQQLQNILGIGNLAAGATTQLNLQLISLLSVHVLSMMLQRLLNIIVTQLRITSLHVFKTSAWINPKLQYTLA